ncbi:MAG: hypothetical protein ABIH92_05980 [Nanoarchaeota archaeon]
MRKIWWALIGVVVVLLLVVVFQDEVMNGPPIKISDSTKQKRMDSFEAEPEFERELVTRSQYLGFLSVTNFTTEEDTTASLEIARDNADYLMRVSDVNWDAYVGGWEDVIDEKFDELILWKQIADFYGLDFYVNIDVLEGMDRSQIDQSIPWEDKSFANPNVRAAFKNYAKRVAVEIQPEYLTLGLEMNTYEAAEPGDYENFLSLYDETFEFIKQVQPGIKIGTTFQYEQLSDCGDEAEGQYYLLDYFSESDFIGLSTYPRICFENFEDIPGDYYSRVREHTATPLVISESGWPTNSTYYSTAEEQELFLRFLLEETNELEAELLIWWFMHDCYDDDCLFAYGSGQFFISSGLLNSDGSAKLAWDDWQEFYGRPLKRIRSLSETAEILFVSNRDTGTKRTEIYSMESDGSNQERITFTEEHHFIMGIDGTRRYIVTSRAEVDTNGNGYLDDEDRRALWLIDLESGQEMRLTDVNNHAEGDSFSPDREWIVFLMKVEGEEQSDIYKIRRDGSNLTRLTNTLTAIEGDPEWSNGGTEIVFTYWDADNPRFVLKKMDVDGGNVELIYDGGGDVEVGMFPPGDYDPSWSPDDEWIVFERAVECDDDDSDGACDENWGNGVWHIFKVRRDGSGLVDLSLIGGHDDRAEFLPSFSPDGEFIIFSSYYNASDPLDSLDDVLLMSAASGEIVDRLTTHPLSDKYPVWIGAVDCEELGHECRSDGCGQDYVPEGDAWCEQEYGSDYQCCVRTMPLTCSELVGV